MEIAPSRRSLITGLISFFAAPAIVRASSLMPIKGIDMSPVLASPTLEELKRDPALFARHTFPIGAVLKDYQIAYLNILSGVKRRDATRAFWPVGLG